MSGCLQNIINVIKPSKIKTHGFRRKRDKKVTRQHMQLVVQRDILPLSEILNDLFFYFSLILIDSRGADMINKLALLSMKIMRPRIQQK